MSRGVKLMMMGLILLLPGLSVAGCQNQTPSTPVLQGLPAASENFERVTAPVPLEFPRDHAAHPAYQTEWWYFTGNLRDAMGHAYGFQLTFFRRALPLGNEPSRASGWAADQVYLAHFAVTDIGAREFKAFERLERGAAGLAGAEIQDADGVDAARGFYGARVWLHDWEFKQTGSDDFQIIAQQDGVHLELDLSSLKAPVLQGVQGYSQKGPQAGNASIYYSLTRLQAAGSISVNGTPVEVSGSAWMDHEYSTSALGADQVGWDWFALQLDDDTELMVYTLRKADGSLDEFSRGILIEPDGSSISLQRDDFSIEVLNTWVSPTSGAQYPAGWLIKVPGYDLELGVTPALADQELQLSFIYWEGAVTLTGSRGGKTINGVGYAELTGYARSMQGDF